MNRKREQAVIIDKLGQLFGPVLKIAPNPRDYEFEEKRRIAARFYVDFKSLIQDMAKLCKDEPHHHYRLEHNKIWTSIMGLVDGLSNDEKYDLFDNAANSHATALYILFSIQTSIDSTIHDAVTPFSTYCLVRDLCATANKLVMWMDRYFDQTLFARYLADVPKSAVVTLITYPEGNC